MGLFQHRPEEEENQWVLPSEPLDRDAADVLDAVPSADPLSLGFEGQVTSIVFPVAPVLPEAGADETGEPKD
ncbi:MULTISPECIES: hypothetical protein [Microbacterium]|jgi:hypothetical protein|uniref:hypothetical protein n=1 Tax=Microbacterium TaxID=33882 RepID=UPI000CFC5336|nr:MULTISPECIES: hypothetical protein [unclassified Microbacterium]PRB11138.1 hypothetical protein CQ047_04640 [Microbacterium sp. MYb72]